MMATRIEAEIERLAGARLVPEDGAAALRVAGGDVAVLQRQAADRHRRRLDDVDDAIDAAAVDDREAGAGAADRDRLAEVEIAARRQILAAGAGEDVGAGRYHDRVRAGGGVGRDHGLAERAVGVASAVVAVGGGRDR